jgi:hypothetical protein
MWVNIHFPRKGIQSFLRVLVEFVPIQLYCEEYSVEKLDTGPAWAVKTAGASWP